MSKLQHIGQRVSRSISSSLSQTSVRPLYKTGAADKGSVIGASLGEQKRLDGFQPGHPIILVPGLGSSALVVEESNENPLWRDDLLWLSVQKLSSSKLKSIAKHMGTKFQPPDSRQLSVLEGNNFVRHMMLDPHGDGVSDPEGIRVRPVPGLTGCSYLAKEKALASSSYVMGAIVETLKGVGYEEHVNLFGAPYDWRVPIPALEARDGYFSKMEEQLESILQSQGRPSVLFGHSNGNRVIQYFLHWLEGKNGREWIDKHVYGFMAVGAPFLGSAKGIRCLTTGDRMGLEFFLTESEGKELIRSCGSVPAILPDTIGNHWVYPWSVPPFVMMDQKGYLSMEEALSLAGASHQVKILQRFYSNDPYWGAQSVETGQCDLQSELSSIERQLALLPLEDVKILLGDWKQQILEITKASPVFSEFPKRKTLNVSLDQEIPCITSNQTCHCCERKGVPFDFMCGACSQKSCGNCILMQQCHTCNARVCPFFHQECVKSRDERPILRAPPVARLWNMCGCNQETEIAYFMREGADGGLELDSSVEKSRLPGFVVHDGVVYETCDSPQTIGGSKRGTGSGDGTVPYCSLSFPARSWSKDLELQTYEIPGAKHREILKDSAFLETLLDIVTERVDLKGAEKQAARWAMPDPFTQAAWEFPWCRECGQTVREYFLTECPECGFNLQSGPIVAVADSGGVLIGSRCLFTMPSIVPGSV